MRLKVILLILICSAFHSQEMDAFELLEKSVDKYANTSEYSFNYQMSWNCEGQGNSGVVNGSFLKKGKDFILKKGDGITLKSGEYLININQNDKIIIIQWADEGVNFNEALNVLNEEKEFLTGSTDYGEGFVKLIFVPKPDSHLGYLESAQLEVDNSGWIKSSSYTFSQSAQVGEKNKCKKMAINYAAYKIGNINPNELSASQFVRINGTEVTAAPKYKNYEVISSLNFEQE